MIEKTINKEKLANDNIYKILVQFDKLSYIMNEEEKELIELLIKKI